MPATSMCRSGGVWRGVALAATLASGAIVALPAAAQNPGAVAEDIGSWRLGCVTDRMTDRAACQLRHRDWVERPSAAPGLTLEIQDRNGRLVPVVTARDMGLDGASRGLMALAGRVQIRFGTTPMMEMGCTLEGRSIACFPGAADAARAERDMGGADRALVRLVGLGGAGHGEPTELRLEGTRDAMARFRRQIPAPPAGALPPTHPDGHDLRDLLGRLQRLFQ